MTARSTIRRLLSTTRTVYAACALSLGLGLVFLFVWAPHPWGWLGFDHYHERALNLARGGAFDTTDVPWGYAYFLAALYTVAGDRVWVPLLVQVAANATIPLLLYHLVRPLAGQTIAVASAALTGALSFNTIYASTQSSDAICTTLFMLALVLYARAWTTGRAWLFAASGLVAGLYPQFRPNLILFPLVMAAAFVAAHPRRDRVARAALFLAVTALALTPWTVRNYRVTGEFLPTSTHGGIQLWYGSLEVGPYRTSRAYNPRSVFGAPAFDYTSVTRKPIVVTVYRGDCSRPQPELSLTYWTDRQAQPRRLEPDRDAAGVVSFEIPAQQDRTTVYYYLKATSDAPASAERRSPYVPSGGPENPGVFFVSTDHLGDLDVHGDLLDAFDVVRLLRLVAWDEAPPFSERLDVTADGRVDEDDLRRAIDYLLAGTSGGAMTGAVDTITTGVDDAELRLIDGSTFRVERRRGVRITDAVIHGRLGGVLAYARLPFSALRYRDEPPFDCRIVDRLAINEPFHVREPHEMRRYTALALDNIRREPAAYFVASLLRVARVFVIRGSDDVWTAQQFTASGFVYWAGALLSAAYLAAFVAGAWVAWQRRTRPLLLLLLPIAYVPATISFFLINMRYTVTVQPLLFAFVAVALLAAAGIDDRPAAGSVSVRRRGRGR